MNALYDARHRSWPHLRSGQGVRLLFVLLTFLLGCAPPLRMLEYPPSLEDVRQEAFRAGVQAALRAYDEHYLDNDFPYYNWNAPQVQRVWIPPRIEGGVFIPGHTDYVTLKPGAWKREFAAPLSSHRGLSDERPVVRDHPVGWADEDSARLSSPASRVRIEHDPLHGDAANRTELQTRPWAELPPPDPRWLGKEGQTR